MGSITVMGTEELVCSKFPMVSVKEYRLSKNITSLKNLLKLKILFYIIFGEFECCMISLILSLYNVKLISEKHSNETAGGWPGCLSFTKDKKSISIFKDNQNLSIVLIFYLFLLRKYPGKYFSIILWQTCSQFLLSGKSSACLVCFPCLKFLHLTVTCT